METGAVEYMIIGFPGNSFSGEITPAEFTAMEAKILAG